MNTQRVYAIILHHLYFWKKSMPRWLDIFYWPIVTLAVWGFIANFLSGKTETAVGSVSAIFLGGITLWLVFQRAQQDIAISYLQDIWSRSIVNLYVSPLTNLEFIVASIIIGLIKMVITLTVLVAISVPVYAFNIFSLGIYLVPFIALLLMFAWSLGLFITGVIFRYGSDAQVLAFGLSFILQPIVAVFYPLSTLPAWIKPVALIFPLTHIFEGMRAVFATGALPASNLVWAVVLNIVFLVLCAIYFGRMFEHTKKMGMLAKLE